MGVINVKAFQCERCGHIWLPKDRNSKELSIACAKCKSPYWNKPRIK